MIETEQDEGAVLLQRHAASEAARLNNDRFMQFACCCSTDYPLFWNPYTGLRIAFGSVNRKNRITNLVYVVEFMPKGKEWYITLIASRDPELPALEGLTKVILTTFQGKAPKCPEVYTPRQALLWQKLYDHFGPLKPESRT